MYYTCTWFQQVGKLFYCNNSCSCLVCADSWIVGGGCRSAGLATGVLHAGNEPVYGVHTGRGPIVKLLVPDKAEVAKLKVKEMEWNVYHQKGLIEGIRTVYGWSESVGFPVILRPKLSGIEGEPEMLLWISTESWDWGE